ncbi:MAG: hypothetical protein HKP29_03955 [Silicimonas sp.]|nr:hypothetical protein [Silicimonas sp.]
MAHGFLAGIFWGGVVGVGMLGVSSQTMERQQLSFPKPETSAVDVPGGSEFDQARPETDPVLPGTEPAPAGEVVAGVTPPEDAVETPPAFDTSSLDVPQPSIESPSGLGEAPEVADEVDVPEGADTTRIGSGGNVASGPTSPSLTAPETPVVAPETDTEAPAAGEAPADETLNVTESGAGDDAPEATTEIAALPSETQDTTPSVTESAPAVEPEDEAPASPLSPEISEAPSLPGVRVPEPDTGPAAPEAPVVTEAPEATDAPEVVEAPVQTEAPAETETPESSDVATSEGGDNSFFTPVETLEDRAENVEVNRLPTIGGDDETLPVVRRLPGTPIIGDEEEPDDAPGEAAEADAGAPAVAAGPAIRAFAMDYEGLTGNAVVSIVLMHEGAAALSAAELAAMPDTVAFAVDAGLPNAGAIASAYRQAGREVVLIPSLPAGASPQDVEVALGANLEQVPEAVAVMDVTGSSFQSDRDAVAQVVAVVSDTGHGIITFPRGLNTAHQQAERAGLPTGLIFRLLDEDGETNEQIRRTLDRAAFRARQSDAVILVGHTRAATLEVLRQWAADATGDVSVAPISVALGND